MTALPWWWTNTHRYTHTNTPTQTHMYTHENTYKHTQNTQTHKESKRSHRAWCPVRTKVHTLRDLASGYGQQHCPPPVVTRLQGRQETPEAPDQYMPARHGPHMSGMQQECNTDCTLDYSVQYWYWVSVSTVASPVLIIIEYSSPVLILNTVLLSTVQVSLSTVLLSTVLILNHWVQYYWVQY